MVTVVVIIVLVIVEQSRRRMSDHGAVRPRRRAVRNTPSETKDTFAKWT
jgi:hypothetical protein